MNRHNEPKPRSLEYRSATDAQDAMVDRFDRPVGPQRPHSRRRWKLWRVIYLLVMLALLAVSIPFVLRYMNLLQSLTEQPLTAE